MSIVLIFCVLAAAGWLLLVLINRDQSSDPGDSVAAYSRAMGALDPTAPPAPRHGAAAARPRRPQSGPRRRPTGGRPTAARRGASRRPVTRR